MAGVLSNNFVLLQVEDYGNEASDLPAVLGMFGLHFMCRVGPDHYYSKAPDIGDSFTVRAFEEASERLVAEARPSCETRRRRCSPHTDQHWRLDLRRIEGARRENRARLRHPWGTS